METNLTTGEALCVLAACVQALSNAVGPGMDSDDKQNVMELQSATVKIAKGCGMGLDDLSHFAAMAAGSPTAEVVEFFQERLKT